MLLHAGQRIAESMNWQHGPYLGGCDWILFAWGEIRFVSTVLQTSNMMGLSIVNIDYF